MCFFVGWIVAGFGMDFRALSAIYVCMFFVFLLRWWLVLLRLLAADRVERVEQFCVHDIGDHERAPASSRCEVGVADHRRKI